MPVTIQSAKFSFIRFESVDFFLPAYRLFAEAFQFIVQGFLSTSNKIRLGVLNSSMEEVAVFPSNIFASILSYKFSIPDSIFVNPTFYLAYIRVNAIEKNYYRQVAYKELKQILLNDFGISVAADNTFPVNSISEIVISHAPNNVTELTDETLLQYWGRGYAAAAGNLLTPFFQAGECFQYALIDETGVVIGKTNTFKVLAKDRHTSLLSYKNNENAYEFVYNGAESNVVRLPFYLSRPQWPEKKNVYIKSNGHHKLLSAFIEEQYALKTDHLPTKIHRFLKIALAHDEVIIDCSHLDETPVEVINTDSYQPAWDDELDINTAQGECTVTVAAFGYRNSNCDRNEDQCPAPVFQIQSVTDTSVTLSFGYTVTTDKILINYRKAGMPVWQNVIINPAVNYTLNNLSGGRNYEIKVASNCGDGYGDFSSIKGFVTTGNSTCRQPTSLHLLSHEDPVSNGVTGVFNFEINMPDIPSPNLQLTIQRPDGLIENVTINASGYTANPFLFSYEGASILQTGIYRFKSRSDCGAGEYSLYSNEVTFSNQPAQVPSITEYNFAVFFGGQGTFEILRNSDTVLQVSGNGSGFVNAYEGDFITAIVTSTGAGNANLRITETNTGIQVYDSTGNNSNREIYSFAINANQYHSINANIGG